ncbi:MAG: tetratricopeptide repeat protein [Fuerstiella sp.]|nr:tetratricopeptide repeat protein [Fuerstiella sp.]
MRNYVWLCLVVLALGCGGGSDASAPVAAVPLSINGPSRADTLKPAAASAPLQLDGKTDPVVEQLFQKAQQAAQAGRYAVAVEAISQAIGLNPGDFRLFRLRADIYSLIGEYANARADYSLAIRTEPGNAELRNIRGYFLMSRGLSKEAVADFDTALQLDPEFAAAWNNRGLVDLAKQDYEAAVTNFDRAVTIDDRYADALNNRGFTKFKMGQLPEALADLKRTVELMPGYATAWNNCGLVYMQQHKYALAVHAFSQASGLSPTDVRWLEHRREALKRDGRYEEAGADAEKIRWLNRLRQLTKQALSQPEVSSTWMDRASHLVDGAEYDAAIEDYSRVLTLNPANHEALCGRALVWLKKGNPQKAVSDCNESLIATPTASAFSIRGDAWFELARYDQAIQDFEAAHRFDETVAEAYRKRSDARRAEGNSVMADADRKKADSISAALNGKSKPVESGRAQLPFPE